MTVDWYNSSLTVGAGMWHIEDQTPNGFSFFIKGESEPIIKVDKTGFYVRGKRVPQDENEAKVVYNAFHQHITWSTLNR